MAKRPQKPEGFKLDHVSDVYSLSGCVNSDFADYINLWKHNGYWLFDSPEIIRSLATENSISLNETLLFYYEVYEMEFDGDSWVPFKTDPSFTTDVVSPLTKKLEGFDVVTFFAKNAPECSPLSCNYLAQELHTNQHCLFDSFEDAYANLSNGAFKDAEPGPYRIFAVYSIPT